MLQYSARLNGDYFIDLRIVIRQIGLLLEYILITNKTSTAERRQVASFRENKLLILPQTVRSTRRNVARHDR
jgi:hypothetical protein